MDFMSCFWVTRLTGTFGLSAGGRNNREVGKIGTWNNMGGVDTSVSLSWNIGCNFKGNILFC